MPSLTLQRLGLNEDPFLPELANGQPIDPKLFARALDPQLDPRLLHYYFDVYQWSDSTLVGDLNPAAGLGNFPAPQDVTDPVLLIVSGTEDTGRASLVNLIRHEIRCHSPAMYEVESLNDSRDAVSNVITIGLNFMANWTHSNAGYTAADLQHRFDLYTSRPSAGTKSHYPDLFRQFRSAADACGVDPVVVIVRRTDHHDVWSIIYNSLAPLAKYVIVETTKSEHAKACYDQVTKDGGSVALMDARRLDLPSARQYLAARLKSERSRPLVDEIWPFSDMALAALYKPGLKPQEDGVRWPIGSLRGMLRATFDSHVANLTAKTTALNLLTDLECRITEEVALKASTDWQGSKDKKKQK